MKKFIWKQLKPDGLIARYEHCAMNYKENPKKIFIFGGTNQEKNLNSTQVFNTGIFFSHKLYNFIVKCLLLNFNM